LALALAYRRAGGSWQGWRFARAEAFGLWGASWPLMINSVALVAGARLDQVLLTQLRGPGENGLYAAAQRLYEILYFVPTAVAAAAAPTLIRLHAEDLDRYRAALGRLMRRLFWVAVGFALPLSLLAGEIVQRLFGPRYAGSGPVLALLVWAAPAVFLGVAQSNWFIVEGRTAGLLVRSAVAAVALLLLDLALIPARGAAGAALAVVIAQLLAHVGVNAVDRAARPLLRLQLAAFLPWRRP
jgi:O-antigen/teichoic acid export membrane protein